MKDAIRFCDSQLSLEGRERVKKQVAEELINIQIAQLREEKKVKQSEMKNFKQASVSKIEKRKDMKITTLIDYLDSLGMGLEIIAYSKTDENDSRVLLKV